MVTSFRITYAFYDYLFLLFISVVLSVRATAEVRLDQDTKGTGIGHTSCRRSKVDEITKYSNLIHIR